MFFRLLKPIMTSEAVKKVPIPRRGVDYRGKIVLAPMVRSGELPSRLLALHYGADLVWGVYAPLPSVRVQSADSSSPGPETVDRSMIGTTRRINPHTNCIEWSRKNNNPQSPEHHKENVIYRIHPGLEDAKLVFQIGTADPDRAVDAARTVAADVAGIDVNAGCPKPFSTSGGMGAALLRTPDKLCAILEALVARVAPEFEIGISVKIRLLETAAETEALVRRLVATGITGLTVHCRTTPMRPRERAIRGQLRMVADVCREAGVACLMNGDVETRDQALGLIGEFGVDGAMIATTAEKNSSCFRPEALGGLAPWREVVERYLIYCMDVGNRLSNTKYLLSNMVPGKAPEYKIMSQGRSYTTLCEALGFEDLLDRARDTDLAQGVDPEGGNIKRSKKKLQNAAALAAGGDMAGARNSTSEHRRNLSERGAVSIPELAPAVEVSPAM